MLNKIISIATSIYLVIAIILYYARALEGVKLNYFYFFSFFLGISLSQGLLFAKSKNKWIGVTSLLCCVLFTGITLVYAIDWIGSGAPKLNNIYESFFVGAVVSLIYIVAIWIKTHLFSRK